ncbi:hypothetical protein CPB84DRAFT_1843926 [Gymnopilus junonius]|uniref:Uncharacterized protein n=1 Tax=Gymnopilus junonius TaxID=109634 RepID=A0A9P5TRY7_GYMJU|nr:hypothetical protein CPB84DRAFT_1843926 [Gymnopilus junonius]
MPIWHYFTQFPLFSGRRATILPLFQRNEQQPISPRVLEEGISPSTELISSTAQQLSASPLFIRVSREAVVEEIESIYTSLGSPPDEAFRPLKARKRVHASARLAVDVHQSVPPNSSSNKKQDVQFIEPRVPQPGPQTTNIDSLNEPPIPGAFNTHISNISTIGMDDNPRCLSIRSLDTSPRVSLSSFTFSDIHYAPEVSAEERSESASEHLRDEDIGDTEHGLLSTGKFKNGQKLTQYQLADLHRLLERERGEEVCGTSVVNNVGMALAFKKGLGLGKTVMSIALIACNPPPIKFEGARATM